MIKNQIVSVVVPIYNVEKYLLRCINSIRAQTYKYLDIILVDDGSLDNSGSICDDAAKMDERITVLHKTNGGLSDARNAGIDIAKGSYICFIDSDDVIAEYFVESLLHLCVSTNAQVAVGRYQMFDEKVEFSQTEREKIAVFSGEDAVKQLLGNDYVTYVIACNKLYDIALFESIRYPKGLLHEDEATTYKLLYNANRVVETNHVVYGYYMRQNSITTSSFSIKRLDYLKIAKERADFFRDNHKSELYDKFLYIYTRDLLMYYRKVKKQLNRKDIASMIKKEYREKLSYLIRSPNVSLKQKNVILVSGLMPNLYGKYREYKTRHTEE